MASETALALLLLGAFLAGVFAMLWIFGVSIRKIRGHFLHCSICRQRLANRLERGSRAHQQIEECDSAFLRAFFEREEQKQNA